MKVIDIKLPQQGASMTDGVIVEWLIGIGEEVEKGQEIVEIETAKTTFPVKAPSSGRLASIEYDVDETANVGDVIAKLETDAS